MRTRPPKISTAPGRSLDDTVSSRVSRTSTSRFSLRRKKQLEDLSSTIVIRQHVDPHRAHGRHDSQHGSHHGSDSPLPGTPTSTLPGSPTLIEESASFGRAATWSSSVANSDAPSSQPAMDSIKRPQVHATSTSTTDRQPVKAKTKALGEINPVWNGYRSGLHLDLKTLRFAVPAFKAVRLVAGLLPDLKYCSAEERAEVNLERVREAQTWLEHSIAIYRASAAAPLLVRAQANRANAAEIVRYLGGPREVEMLRFMEQGGAFTSRFAICYVPKMEAVVVAVRGTAGLHEALADLVGVIARCLLPLC
ncbi:hypothetical protein DFJ74DRAFT_666659 [Hyaloraphidium curvatum]|nr:hypothetical protein DFJ74DRAFT_666659 [Hyaloraphidium curvatum]